MVQVKHTWISTITHLFHYIWLYTKTALCNWIFARVCICSRKNKISHSISSKKWKLVRFCRKDLRKNEKNFCTKTFYCSGLWDDLWDKVWDSVQAAVQHGLWDQVWTVLQVIYSFFLRTQYVIKYKKSFTSSPITKSNCLTFQR